MREMFSRLLPLAICGCLIGCTTNESGSPADPNMAQRQDKALRDPFGYSPSNEIPDISGGGINNYDGRGMGRDIDHVLNP